MLKQKIFKLFIFFSLFFGLIYGAGRLYFQITDGFSPSEISSDFIKAPLFNVKPLAAEQKNKIESILSQNFYYLGKGCQSYVFRSEDDQYVIKFLKYKHLRPYPWLNVFSFIGSVREYHEKKMEMKKKKLEDILTSWKLAYENLPEETGVLFVHLNPSSDLQALTIYDKMGQKFQLDLNHLEFLIQKKADSFVKTLEKEMREGQKEKAKALIDQIFNQIVSEYERGFGDNDHALMQNTGVLNGVPIHVDVGQFVRNENFKKKEVRDQEIFNKTYRFKTWLKKTYPELATHLQTLLFNLIGPKVDSLIPKLKSLSCDE